MSCCYLPCCALSNVCLWQARTLWPGLRDRSNTLGRRKCRRGQEGCCEPVPFGVGKLEIILCSQFFFSQFSAFLAPFLSNYSLFWTSDKIAPGRTISQHFQLGLVGILIPYDHFVWLTAMVCRGQIAQKKWKCSTQEFMQDVTLLQQPHLWKVELTSAMKKHLADSQVSIIQLLVPFQ